MKGNFVVSAPASVDDDQRDLVSCVVVVLPGPVSDVWIVFLFVRQALRKSVRTTSSFTGSLNRCGPTLHHQLEGPPRSCQRNGIRIKVTSTYWRDASSAFVPL